VKAGGRRPSLARRIALGFFLSYAAVLLLALQTLRFAGVLEEDSHLGADVAAETVFADLEAADDLILRPDAEVHDLARRNPGLWFVAREGARELAFGPVPDSVIELLDDAPGRLEMLEMRLPAGGPTADVSLERRETDQGAVTVVAGGVDMRTIDVGAYNLFIYRFGMFWIIPVAILLALPAIAAILPLVLRGVRPLAHEAERIDERDLARRLPEAGVVKELLPIVRAFNAALDRLSTAFERRRRFIADVAHELRTPLAVLNMHVEALPEGGPKPDLQRGVFRLGAMVGQMLDAERLTLAERRREPVDLVSLARAAAADVAPLALASGYDVAVASEVDRLIIDADRHALGRALGNLLGNAVAHGGGHGLIEVRVRSDASLEVSDQGPGVPPDTRERIFEPFRRERWDRDGCGLGLHLVREIMTAHGGTAALLPSPRGATFRLAFRPGA